jgi:hypothetical protein
MLMERPYTLFKGVDESLGVSSVGREVAENWFLAVCSQRKLLLCAISSGHHR